MKMMKMFAFALAVAMLMSAAACAQTDGPAESLASKEPAESSVLSEDASAASEDAASVDSEGQTVETITYEGESRKKVNVFISNFAEQNFYSSPDAGRFDVSNAKVEDLLTFVYFHIKLNSYRDFENVTKGECHYAAFSFDKAAQVVGRYMSCMLKEDDCKKLPAAPATFEGGSFGPFYEDGKVLLVDGDGERYTNIGVVDHADNTGDGTLTLYFAIYDIDYEIYDDLSDEQLEKYYTLTIEEADNDTALTKYRTGVATVDVGQSGDYYLMTYEVKGI